LAGRVAAELQLAGWRLAAGTRVYLQVRFTGCAATSPAAHDCNFDCEHHSRITNGRHPADLVCGGRNMEPR
jgi:hypothetical protein